MSERQGQLRQLKDPRDIWRVLDDVMDPEIPVISIVELGIVRDVITDPDLRVVITPTYVGCPATALISDLVSQALSSAGYQGVALETRLTPPWTTDWISKSGHEKLREYGIAPPTRGTDRPNCPRCGSSETEKLSEFGSTPCKALHRCLTCHEPFDRFKCH